ncbi:PKD domain-containing protein [Flaviaesturariibacter aridisoli]|uniref:PKD domain-containing protein n=1 Tax=Flaviaesturariibacter aridisoli TaxID=2545761 RepID=A0A4R4E3U1_9BACT|nr:PKD domain-containing protein [Flaviaesturariibacter aridisoli]TCZ74099.1 PKD domain-containing protein [Flaviaesturariibacter aridisoli]
MKKIFILLLGVLLSVYGIAQSARTRAPRGSVAPASTQRLPADSFTWSGYQPVAGICPGGTLTIHATHFPAGATFQWTRNGAPIPGATRDSLVTGTPGDVSVEVTDGATTYFWPVLQVTAFSSPVPSFSAAPDGQCSTTPIQFTNNTAGANTYLWNFNDPNAGLDSVSTGVNPLHFFLGGPLGGAQTFNVSLTATNTEGCPATVSQSVHTNSPSTNLGGSGLTSFNGQPVFTSCTSTGATLTFINNSTTTGTNTDYVILWGDNSTNFTPNATFTSVNHTYAPGTYTLAFAVTGAGGCRDTGYYGVYIGSNPAVGLSNPGNTVTCSESSLTFPITSTGSNSPGTSYTVAFNDGSAPQVFNHPAPANVTHNFLISSCNTTSTSGSTSYPNSFSATIRATNPCGSSSASIVPIYVSKKPVPILNVGPSDVVCTNVPVTVSNASGNMQSVSNGVCSPGKVVWKISPATGYTVTGVLGNDLNSPDPGVWTSGNTTLNIVFNTPGTYRVRMLVGNTSLCPIDSIDQVICVNGHPTADFTLSASAGCAPFNVTSVNASVPAFCNPNRYDWTVSYSNTTGCTPSASNWSFANSSNTNSTNPEFTFTNPGVYTVQLVTTPPGNTCFATSTQTVTVKTKPTVDWQPLAPICQGQFSPVATVNDCFASTPSTYLWTFNGGTPATSVSATPVADYPNTGTFNVTLDVSNECGTTSLAQPLVVNPTPTVNAPANQVVCNTSTAPATAFVSPLPGISFTWTNDNPAIGLPASGSGDVPAFIAVNTTNTPIVATITVIPSSSTCSGPARTYTITVNPTPPINAGADQIICNASSVTMQAVLAPGTTGVWDQIPSSNTTIVTPASPTTSITGLVPNATYQFRWTVTGTGICATVSDTVTILNRPLPSPASAGNDTLICDFVGGIFSSFNLQGNNPTHPWELGTWTVVAGSNTLNAAPTIVDPNQGGSLINTVGLGAGPLQGSITLQWSISNDGGCPATSDQMTITIVRRPSAGTLGPINPICFNSSASISATGYEGNIVKWRRQDAPLATNPFIDVAGNTTPNISLANLTGDVALQFIVAPVNALCLKNDTASIVLPVDGAINNSISGRIDSVCSGVSYNTGNFPATGGNGGVPSYQWQSSDDGITFTNLGTFTLSDYTFNPDHTVWLRRLVTIGTCPSISDTIKVWVEPPVTNNTITASQTICANTPPAPLAGSLPTAFGGAVTLTYQWESSSNGVNFISIPGANGQNYAPGVLNQNTWYRRIVRSNRCPTPTGGISDTVLISVTPAPVASFVPSAVQGCSPMTVTFTNNTIGTGNTYTWDFGDGSAPLVTTSGAPLPHTFTTGVLRNFTVSLSATNICGSSTQNIVLTVQPNSVDLNLTVNGNQLSGCAPHTVKFYSSSPGGTQFTWNFQDGSPSVSTINPIDSQTHVYTTPGVYNMTLRGQNNCSDTTGHITITVYAKPTAAFTPATLQACVGAPITFNNGSTGATSYQWNFGDSPATTATASPQHSYSTPGTYTVMLVAYNTNAGGLVTCTDTLRTNVQIVASQTGSMTVSGTTSTCAPFAVTFTNNTTPASSVLWDFNDGSPTSSLNTVNHTFLLAGTYNVTLTVNTPAGCQYVTTQAVTVSGPSGTLQYTGGYKCDGQSTHFEVVGGGATSYTWDMGDGSAPVTNNSSSFDYVYPNPGTYTPKVTMNSGACAYLITGSSLIRADRLRVGFTSQTVQSCGSTAITFTDTSSVFFGVVSTKWTFSNGNIVNNATTTTQTFTNSNTLHATLQVTGTSGCILTKDIDMPVTVWSNPVVTLVPPAGNQGCARQPVTFDAVINSADPIANVQWLTSNGINGTGRPFLPIFGTPGTYTADLSVSTVNGCAVNLTSPLITINPSPTVSIVDPAPICRGGSANLQANASGAANLQWSPTAGLSCTTCPNPVATPLFTTPYIVTATNAFGCSASDTAIVDVTQPITMTVLPASDSICIGDSIQLLASGATSYSWVTQATAVLSCSTCPNPVFRPLVPGIYSATVTGANSCFTQTIPITIGVGGIPEINLGPDLVLATGTVKPLVSTVTNGPIVSWLWSPATDLSCSTCPQPSVTVRQNRTYVVEGANGFGCTNTDTLTIRTVCELLQTYIPNAFSPDGDGINDVLMVRGTGIAQVKSFRVFNRWGETVYERANFAPNDPAFGWDGKVKGKVSSPDVFIYTAEVVCENGITYTYKGNVSLLK